MARDGVRTRVPHTIARPTCFTRIAPRQGVYGECSRTVPHGQPLSLARFDAKVASAHSGML